VIFPKLFRGEELLGFSNLGQSWVPVDDKTFEQV